MWYAHALVRTLAVMTEAPLVSEYPIASMVPEMEMV